MGLEQIRCRKDALVPISHGIEEFKIEIVDMTSFDEFSMLNLNTHQIIEVVTSSPSPSSSSVCSGDGGRPRKRAKLDHLSADEKTQHRKMMNRMSAQSARDRQRAMIQHQEQALKDTVVMSAQLKDENKKLKATNQTLAEENASLKSVKEENEKLKALVEKLTLELSSRIAAEVQQVQEAVTEVVIPSHYPATVKEESCVSMEPAVPSTVPLPKGLESQLIFLFTLLIWETCFKWTSTPLNFLKLWKTSQRKSSLTTGRAQLLSKCLQQKNIVQALQKLEPKWSQMRVKPPD